MNPCVLCGDPVDYCTGHSEDWKRVESILHEEVAPEVTERVVEIIHTGTARWIWDPNVENVAGLVKGGTDYALMVVYVEARDFEVSLDFYGPDNE